MQVINIFGHIIVALAMCGVVAPGSPANAQELTSRGEVSISELNVQGEIEGSNITFTVEFNARVEQHDTEIPLIAGPAALVELNESTGRETLRYDPSTGAYYINWRSKGNYHLKATFAAHARPVAPVTRREQTRVENQWLEASFTLPPAQVRTISFTSSRTDMDVRFSDAMRLERKKEGDKVVLSAILGPGKPLTVRFKPQVQRMDADLVCSAMGNVIATVSAANLRVDSHFTFDISQGSLGDIKFLVPESLSITQVRGQYIQDWSLEQTPNGRFLKVSLSRQQDNRYSLLVQGEHPVGTFPTDLNLPVVDPVGMLRASGYLAVGTDSSIQLQISQTSGLTQIDARSFPLAQVDSAPQRLPANKVFAYAFSASRYNLSLRLDDITPAFDVLYHHTVRIKDEDLTVDAEMYLDVREAPLRDLLITFPAGYQVATLQGALVDDYRVDPASEDGSKPTRVHVQFKQPVIGKTNLTMRLELGQGPLEEEQTIEAISIPGAKTARGFVAVSADDGLRLSMTKTINLREVNVASLDVVPPDARLAYRFRQEDWTMSVFASKEPPSIRTESFHLVSLGEGRAHGSVAISYFITGSPVDELCFTLSPLLKNVQFVGLDVRRAVRDENDPTRWRVHLQRRVIGDYNLGVTYDLPYELDEPIIAGGVQCENADSTQTGYIVVTSHLNMELETSANLPVDDSIMEISRDEVPANYRLLANAPILKTFKYDRAPHSVAMAVSMHHRAQVVPVIIEVMNASTKMAVRQNNRTESVTSIRYMIKNSSNQFLSLRMPAGATVWSARLIESNDNGGETTSRLAVSVDEKGELMIPLPRYRNPNDPITIELEYGQTHDLAGRWQSQVSLVAPVSDVPATFANWVITANANYAIKPHGGNMIPAAQAANISGAGRLLRNVAKAWRNTLMYQFQNIASMGIVVLVGVLVLGLIRRRAFRSVVICGVLLFWLFAGFRTASSSHFAQLTPAPANTVEFTQMVNLREQGPLTVDLTTVPAWRRDLTVASMVGVPIIALALVAGGIIIKRFRGIFFCAACSAAIVGTASLSSTHVLLGHLFTWGLPFIMAVLVIGRFLVSRTRRTSSNQVIVGAVALLALVLGGCDINGPGAAISPQPTIERIEYTMSAEEDSMVIDCVIQVASPTPAEFDLIGPEAVLLSQKSSQPHVSIEIDEKGYILKLDRPGRAEVSARFLHPLREADHDGARSFSLPMPLSLSNTVELTVPETQMDIVAVGAYSCTPIDAPSDDSTTVRAILPPGKDINFTWKPRTRQREKEETRFYAQVTSAVCFNSSLVSIMHDIRLQIAMGELRQTTIAMPANTVVTAVGGDSVGAWRFDPATNELDVRFAVGVTGDQAILITAQSPADALPYEFNVMPIVVDSAQRQQTFVGILSSSDVYVEAQGNAQPINVDDFARDASDLIKQIPQSQSTPAFAYRMEGESVSVRAGAVLPELRVNETTTFNVMDERHVINTRLDIQIAKAGVFLLTLEAPADYDIDALAAPALSHWDDNAPHATTGRRTITLHFKQKTIGNVPVSVTMSRPISNQPPHIDVPRITVAASLRHTGQAVVKAQRGLRLLVDNRDGVTEVNPLELNIRDSNVLAFRLLKPNWSIRLGAEVIEPLVNIDTLHVARISDGIVRHQHYLQYRLFHAGTKSLVVQLPPNAVGVTIAGADIANRQELEPGTGLWQIELAKKIFDAPYRLAISYQHAFDRTGGQLEILPIKAIGADQQRGHVVVYTTDRVEIRPQSVDMSLQPAEARSVPGRMFGAGDLSDAAFCYSTSSPDYSLSLLAVRHSEARQIEANVHSTHISTVITESGQSISRVLLTMSVGSKRYLRCRLPEGSQLWSALVNGRSATPSKEANSPDMLLIPLPQASGQDINVEVDMVYVMPRRLVSWAGNQKFAGPAFDLPLKDIKWSLFVPEHFGYDSFGGTMNMLEGSLERAIRSYDLDMYKQSVSKFNLLRNKMAMEYQDTAKKLAEEGKQYGAREMLQQAKTYSLSDSALNEDINVDLDNLLRQQAKVGLVASRARLRSQTSAMQQATVGGDLGDHYNQAQAQQIEHGLSRADNENLDLISRRIIEAQEAAVDNRLQLIVELPNRGKMLEFTRPLLVSPLGQLEVAFNVSPKVKGRVPIGMFAGVALFVGLAVCMVGGRWAIRTTFNRQPSNNDTDDERPVSKEELLQTDDNEKE